MTCTIAIVGSPNVGKSTLFNRLVKRKMAIVGDCPGMTRDRLYGKAIINGFEFNVIDTAGIENENSHFIAKQTNDQTEIAIDEAHLALFLIDSKSGITPYDHLIAKFLRKKNIPIIIVSNKMETHIAQRNFHDIYSFGFKEIVEISAEHGIGISDLYSVIIKLFKQQYPDYQLETKENPTKTKTSQDKNILIEGKEPTDSSNISSKPLRIAIVGRPNVGKSTLINRLLGYNRVLTGPKAGTTHDSIPISWEWKNHPIKIFDTAGMRKPSRIIEQVEKKSVTKSMQSIRVCETTIVLLDATVPFEKQDLRIVDSVINTGRAAVLAFNKWDLVTDKSILLQNLRIKATNNLPQAGNIRIEAISGHTGEGLDNLMASVLEINKLWKTRISTSRLNSWLEQTQLKNPPPTIAGRYHRLKYITQTQSSPPSFVIFCNSPKEIPESYKRYLINRLRFDFSLSGIPIRIRFQSSKNPYIKK
ncbi:GTP-binding protein EngA [Candidatus Liberibacter solanacearum]|uniref:GTPase Der n=1 Tax=Candidatus Liberibacter solanacearum TaxID=556287 RepID=A0A095A011_9HYPH|nr:ribosome biogenesis GTPase Der [Candidatus Liberibacter solanacearum]KGB27476.1 GTP-binding protein EngA [Candidatus Liberibacter solanacearum]KJZ82258.1 GTP-binding protein EngA [Candidatus Liberibacter solanacearum]KQC49328.1 ribosome-associated GTPase EngA [Candidatus Liberibacter solanacearum]